MSSLDSPSKDNLGWCLAMLSSNLANDGLVQNRLLFRGHSNFNIGWGSKIAESCDSDLIFFAVSQEFLLSVVWMKLNLEDSWLDLGITENVSEENNFHVADSNVLHKAFGD
jgi:hypothetical protein